MSVQSCPHCESPNPIANAFCSECGLALPGVTKTHRFYFGDPQIIPSTRIGRAAFRLELRNHVGRVTTILTAVGVICLTIGVVFVAAVVESDTARQAIAAEAAIGMLFLGLAFWSRRSPLPASIVGLAGYITLVALNVVVSVLSLENGHFHGIGIGCLDVAVIIALARGIQNAVEYRAMDNRLRQEEEAFQASHPVTEPLDQPRSDPVQLEPMIEVFPLPQASTQGPADSPMPQEPAVANAAESTAGEGQNTAIVEQDIIEPQDSDPDQIDLAALAKELESAEPREHSNRWEPQNESAKVASASKPAVSSFNGWRYAMYLGVGAAALVIFALACVVGRQFFLPGPSSSPSPSSSPAVNMANTDSAQFLRLAGGDIISLLNGVPGSATPNPDNPDPAIQGEFNNWWTQNGFGVSFKSNMFCKAFLNDSQNGSTRVLLQFERSNVNLWGNQAIIRFVAARAVTIPDVERRAWVRLVAGAQVAVKGTYAGKVSISRDSNTGKVLLEVPVDVDVSSLQPAILPPGSYLTPELVKAIRNAPDNLMPPESDPSHDIVALMTRVPSDIRIDDMLEWSAAQEARFDDWWRMNAVGGRFTSSLMCQGANTSTDAGGSRFGVQPIFEPIPCHIWGFEGKIRIEPSYLYFDSQSAARPWKHLSRRRQPVNGTIDGPIRWEVAVSLGRVNLMVHVPVSLDESSGSAGNNANLAIKPTPAQQSCVPGQAVATTQPAKLPSASPIVPIAVQAPAGRRLVIVKRNRPASQRDPSQDFLDLVNQVPKELWSSDRLDWSFVRPKDLDDWWNSNAKGKSFTATLYVASYQCRDHFIRSIEFAPNPCKFWGKKALVSYQIQLKTPLGQNTFSHFPTEPIEVTGRFAGLFDCQSPRGQGFSDVNVPIETDERVLVERMLESQNAQQPAGDYHDVIQVDDIFHQILATMPPEIQPDDHAAFSPQALEKIQAWWAQCGEGKPFEGILHLNEANEQYDINRPNAHLIKPAFYSSSAVKVWGFRPMIWYMPEKWILVNAASLARWKHAKTGSYFYASGKFDRLEVGACNSIPPSPYIRVYLKFDDADGLIDAKLDGR